MIVVLFKSRPNPAVDAKAYGRAEARWRDHPDHAAARARRADFYDGYEVQVCGVLREWDWTREQA